MARLPYPEPEALDEPTRQLLQKLPTANLFRMVSHAQSALRPFVLLGDALLYRSELSPRLRELSILRVGHLCSAPYEVFQHQAMAREVGLSEEKIAAAAVGLDAAGWEPTEQIVLRLVDEMVRQVRASDETFALAANVLSPRQLTELVMTIGYYAMVARILETLDVDQEARQLLPGKRPT